MRWTTWNFAGDTGAMKKFAAAASSLVIAGVLSACSGGSPSPQSGSTVVPEETLGGDSAQSSSTLTESEEISDAEVLWNSWDTRTRASSLLVLHVPGVDTATTARFLEEVRPAGLILMGDNIPDPESSLADQTAQWQAVASEDGLPPFVVSIDQEGGLVRRLQEDPAPGPGDLRGSDPSEVADAFAQRGAYLGTLGINVNFGIVADATDDSDSFIYHRVLGTDPSAAADAVAAAVTGERDGSDSKVASTIKHFPGHGLTTGDSHQVIAQCGVTDLDQWRSRASAPFAAGIGAGADLVMMSHVDCPVIANGPASLQAAWYEVLRDDLDFDGVIVTDDMSMLTSTGDSGFADPVKNAVNAIAAGATLVLSIGGDDLDGALSYAQSLINGIAAAVESGQIPRDVFDEAGVRALGFRLNLP